MPLEINGTEIDTIRVNGDEQDRLEIGGTTVHQSQQYVDSYAHGAVGDHYAIDDEGQATWPTATSSAAHRDEDYGLDIPSGNPNEMVSLPSSASNYSSSEQPETVESYIEPGDSVEFYFYPAEFDSNSMFRIILHTDTYSQHSCLRIPLDGDGYWRLEEVDSSGSWEYYGDPAENWFDWSVGDLHRIAVTTTNWPEFDAYLYNLDAGDELVSELQSGSGSGDKDGAGFGFWWNNDTSVEISGFRKIDDSEILL